MTKYLYRTCPKCKDYLGVVVRDPPGPKSEIPIDAHCVVCGFKLGWKVIVGLATTLGAIVQCERYRSYPEKEYRKLFHETLKNLAVDQLRKTQKVRKIEINPTGADASDGDHMGDSVNSYSGVNRHSYEGIEVSDWEGQRVRKVGGVFKQGRNMMTGRYLREKESRDRDADLRLALEESWLSPEEQEVMFNFFSHKYDREGVARELGLNRRDTDDLIEQVRVHLQSKLDDYRTGEVPVQLTQQKSLIEKKLWDELAEFRRKKRVEKVQARDELSIARFLREDREQRAVAG